MRNTKPDPWCAPHWDAEARGLFCGISRGTTAAHVARATVESIAYQVRDVFDAMRADASRARPADKAAPSALLADGGASRNDTLMQFQADILGCAVDRDDSADLGSRRCVARGPGCWRLAVD